MELWVIFLIFTLLYIFQFCTMHTIIRIINKNKEVLLLVLFPYPFSQNPSHENLWSKLFAPTILKKKNKITQSMYNNHHNPKIVFTTWFLILTKSSHVFNFSKKNKHHEREHHKTLWNRTSNRLPTRQQLKFMRVHFAVNWLSTIRNLAFWFRTVTAGPPRLANELSTHWWIQLFIKPLGNLKGEQETCRSPSGKWNLSSL